VRWLGPHEASLTIPYVLPVPPGHRPEQVAIALGRLVERHEALRTTYRDGRQRVLRAGSLDVALRTGDPEEVAFDLAAEPFRHADEVPVRCAIVSGAVALAVSHLSADWAAMLRLEADFAALLRGDDLPPPPWHPVDQAAAEAAPAAVEAGAAALAYWRQGLARVPRSLFDFPTVTPEPERYVRLGMDSPAMAAAVLALADQWRVSTGSVLAVVAATALATLTGHETAGVRLVIGNRREPPVRDMVGQAAQDGLLVLDLTAPTLREIVHDGHERARTAYRHARYDPDALDAVKGSVRHERGASIDLLAFVNDMRLGRPWSALRPGGTRFFVDFTTPVARARAFFTIEYAPDTCLLYVLVDTAYLSRETGYALLRGVEALLLSALDEDAPTDRIAEVAGLTPVRRPDDWVRVGPDWYRPDAVVELVREACGASEVTVDRSLTAYLVPGAGVRTPEAAHALVMAAIAGRTDVIAPRRYVLCTEGAGGAETDGGSGGAWAAAGTGREPLNHDGP
jgi:hypothetical protein